MGQHGSDSDGALAGRMISRARAMHTLGAIMLFVAGAAITAVLTFYLLSAPE